MTPTNREESHWSNSLPSPASLLPSPFLLPSVFSLRSLFFLLGTFAMILYCYLFVSLLPSKKTLLGREAKRGDIDWILTQTDLPLFVLWSVCLTWWWYLKINRPSRAHLCPFMSLLFSLPPPSPHTTSSKWIRHCAHSRTRSARTCDKSSLPSPPTRSSANVTYLTSLHSVSHSHTHTPCMYFINNSWLWNNIHQERVLATHPHTPTLSAMSLVRPHITHTPPLHLLSPPLRPLILYYSYESLTHTHKQTNFAVGTRRIYPPRNQPPWWQRSCWTCLFSRPARTSVFTSACTVRSALERSSRPFSTKVCLSSTHTCWPHPLSRNDVKNGGFRGFIYLFVCLFVCMMPCHSPFWCHFVYFGTFLNLRLFLWLWHCFFF